MKYNYFKSQDFSFWEKKITKCWLNFHRNPFEFLDLFQWITCYLNVLFITHKTFAFKNLKKIILKNITSKYGKQREIDSCVFFMQCLY